MKMFNIRKSWSFVLKHLIFFKMITVKINTDNVHQSASPIHGVYFIVAKIFSDLCY